MRSGARWRTCSARTASPCSSDQSDVEGRVVGGVLGWHGGSRDGVMAKFLSRDWWKAEDGTMIGHERSFDPLSGILTIDTAWEGRSGRGTRQHRIRLYTATRLAELCLEAGLVVEQAYEGFQERALRRQSSEMLLVARRPY